MSPLEACAHFPEVGSGPAVPMPGGHIHHTWVVADRWVVQACNETVFPDLDGLMANVTVVADIDPRLRPLPTSSGSSIWRDGSGVAWRARAFIPGHSGSAADAHALGRGLGRFHRSVVDIDPARLRVHVPGFHDPRPKFAALGDPAALSRFAWVLELADRLQALPVRVAHFDAKAENFILDDAGNVVALVDLDTVMPGSWLWDVGDLVRSTCGTRAEDEPDGMWFDPAVCTTAVDAYLDEVGDLLTPDEQRAVPAAGLVVTFEQAVRFLADHQAGDRYYPVDRPGHNLDRYRAQLALLDSMASEMRY